MRCGSAATGVREIDFTSFPAIRAIVKPVHAETNVIEAFTNGAVLVAGALILGLVALDAEDWANGHRAFSSKKTLPERGALRQDGDFLARP
jgi:hypothetical protein